MFKKHFIEVQIVIAIVAVSGAFQGWRVEDARIREARAFCESENTRSESQDVFLNVEGWDGRTLRVSTPWGEDPQARVILYHALILDLDVRVTLLSHGFTTIREGQNIEIKIPAMPKPVKVYPNRTAKPESNPYPVES